MLLRLETLFDRFSDVMGWIAGVLNLLMLVNVFYDAIMRYFFSTGSIALQEMEWHLFAMVFLVFGAVLSLLAAWIAAQSTVVAGSTAALLFFGGYAAQFIGHANGLD